MRWFRHDTSAHLDAKLQKVRIKYGLEGYGLYFYCLELIAMNIDEKNLTFELEHDSEIIAFNTGMHYERVQEILSYMVKLELFENNKGMITCYKLASRLDQSMTSNAKMRSLIAKIKENPELIRESHDLIMMESEGSHDGVMMKSDSVMQEEIRLDKKRIDKSKEDNKNTSGRFTPPTLEEIISYCRERKNTVDANKFFNHYESTGWMRGKNKIKDWKACVRTWESENNKQTPLNQPTRKAMPRAGTVQ